MTAKFPPLPEPFFGITGFVKLNAPYAPAFSTYQMEDYGKLCHEAAFKQAHEAQRKVLEQALGALQTCRVWRFGGEEFKDYSVDEVEDVITAIQEVLK